MAYDISELRKENTELEGKLERLRVDFDIIVRALDWFKKELETRDNKIFSLTTEIEVLKYKLKEAERNGKNI